MTYDRLAEDQKRRLPFAQKAGFFVDNETGQKYFLINQNEQLNISEMKWLQPEEAVLLETSVKDEIVMSIKYVQKLVLVYV